MLREPTGLSLLTGLTDEARTWLITALGNSVARGNRRAKVSGLDLHDPVSFSPVPGVLYYRGKFDPRQVASVVKQLWASIVECRAHLILLNRVWTTVPELQPEIQRLAAEKHVIVADEFDADSLQRMSRKENNYCVRILKISTHQANSTWLRVEMDYGKQKRQTLDACSKR